jgi:SAM-dependent methyltransferase
VKKQSLEEIEALSLKTYDSLAAEYYSPAHPTSQAFDRTIDRYLSDHPPTLRPKEWYLDVGSGRTKLSQIEKTGSANVLLVDISRRMILHSHKAWGERIVASAFRMPIRPGTLLGIYSFLGDAYSTQFFLREAFLLLKNGGELVMIIPSDIWASALRRELKIPFQMTMFVSKQSQLFAPSFTIPRTVLELQLSEVGFHASHSTELFLPSDFSKERIPEHILIPSRVLKIDPYRLPILSLVKAVK